MKKCLECKDSYRRVDIHSLCFCTEYKVKINKRKNSYDWVCPLCSLWNLQSNNEEIWCRGCNTKFDKD